MTDIYSTKHFIMDNGERYKLLVNATTGIPLYYPTLYITSQIRGGGQSVSTIQSFITSLKVLLRWLDHYSVDMEERFRRKEFLTLQEVESLRDFCKKPLKEKVPEKSNVIALKRTKEGARMAVSKPSPGVYSHTQYNRMTFIADYLKWLAEILTKDRYNTADKNHISEMHKRIKAHRPKKKRRTNRDRDEKGLDPKVVEQVMDILKPGHEKNPFHDPGVQVRNALILAMLRFLGLRRGELLNLRVEDINFVSNEVHIFRRPDSLSDPRTYQPLAKTLERTLLINDKLAEKISKYVTTVRSKFIQARRHPYLFITHKAGPYQGAPLSNSAFGKLMKEVQGVSDNFSGVHAHSFRHTWNYTFSALLDTSKEEVSSEREEQMRSYLMGWADGSGTAAIYNRRHIKEKAKKAILEHQKGMIKGGVFRDGEK
ncbi:MAG: site-specific integrase [Desulfobacterium sp.]|nr:site-specific integrase [Desulfobacterium sp.]